MKSSIRARDTVRSPPYRNIVTIKVVQQLNVKKGSRNSIITSWLLDIFVTVNPLPSSMVPPLYRDRTWCTVIEINNNEMDCGCN